jgi:plastocyanin
MLWLSVQSRRSVLGVTLIAALAASALGACGNESHSTGAGGHHHDEIDELIAGPDPTCVGERGQRVVVEMDENVFIPGRLELPRGKPVTIHVVNVGSATHTFTIDELGCDTQQLIPDESLNITFVVSDHAVEFHCTLHEDMHGDLIPI